MSVELSDEEFDLVHAALAKATSMYGEEDIVAVLIALRKARRLMDALEEARTHD